MFDVTFTTPAWMDDALCSQIGDGQVGVMKHMSLCTGYGGIDLALADVFGAETVAVADIDKGACKILAHRYPGIPNLGDITTTDWTQWVGNVDVISAGYPCQPFSQAGRRLGQQDDRHIWPHIADAVAVIRPALVVFENVRGHLSLGFDDVVRNLHQLGYDVHWYLLRASDVGAAHHRARIFIFGVNRERAVCRRADRRRGMDRDHVSVQGPDVRNQRESQHVGQGNPFTESDGGPVRRGCPHGPRSDGYSSVDLQVGADGEGSGAGTTAGRAVPADQGGAMRCGAGADEHGRGSTHRQGRRQEVVAGDELSGRDADVAHQGTEPARTRPAASDASERDSDSGLPLGLVVGAGGQPVRSGGVRGADADLREDDRWPPLRDADLAGTGCGCIHCLFAWDATDSDSLRGRLAGRASDAQRGPELRAPAAGGGEVPGRVMPTPVVNDMGDGKTPEWWADFTARSKANTGNGNGHGRSLAMEATYLPTPVVTDAKAAGPSDDDRHTPQLRAIESYLPTATAMDYKASGGGYNGQTNVTLTDATVRQDWREYEPAIRRQEQAFGRPAPLPTEPGKTGKPRLSPRFSEWLMGLPAGWITDTPGITRNEALKAAGNGVVPQQCAAAATRFIHDLARMEAAA